MTISEIIDEAQAALQVADPLCLDGNQVMTDFKLYLEESTILYSKIQFLHESLQDQLQNMGNLYVILSHSIDKATKESSKQLKRLTTAGQELDALLAILESVPVDPAHSSNGTAENLNAFVHHDDIQSLREQAATLSEELRASFGDMNRIPDRLQKEISSLRNQQPSIEGSIHSIKSSLADLSNKTAPAAHAMADMLLSLTQHYDLACEASTLASHDEFEEAQAVLEKDRLQLDDALQTIKENHQVLIDSRTEAATYKRDLTNAYDDTIAFFDRAESLTSHSLRDYVNKLVEKQGESQKWSGQVETLVAELDGLTEYYRRFHKSYHSLLLEMVRRQKMQRQFRKTINEINASLVASYNAEVNARSDFTKTHGEYLPSDIWSDLEALPKKYSLQFEEEFIPTVDESSIVKALKGLK